MEFLNMLTEEFEFYKLLSINYFGGSVLLLF